MKFRKRFLSIALLLCFLVSLTLPTVSAATGTLERNAASRHITCTSLSSQAEAYYTKGSYDYDTISAMTGVYSTDSWTVTQNNPVYTALQKLMVDTHTNQSVVYSGTSSGSLAYYWNYTDTINSGENYLLFYCDKLMADVQNTEGYSRTSMEREHVWCKSKADFVEASGSGGADLHHLRPSYGYINGIKSNRSFGNVTDGTSCTLDGVSVFTYASNSETGVMEVNDNIKGDIARILLYVYVRWGQPNLYTSYPSDISSKLSTAGVNTSGTITGSDDGTKIIDDLATLMEWMEIDPVDTWEMERNDQIENIQGNRNVFIDYPEYAWIMFGMEDQMPTDMDTPSGMAKSGTSTPSYSITNVTVNNSSYGSASVTGDKEVTAVPNEHYYVASATSTSGTVAINGNIITVSGMTSDATVNVVFAEMPKYTVSYSVCGSVTASDTCYQNESVTLPTSAATVSGYTFAGWVDSPIDPESTTVPSVLTGTYQPTGNTTLYALYTREEIGTGTVHSGYVPSSDAPANGDKVIIARLVNGTYYAMTTASTPSYSALTITDGLVSSSTSSVVWDVSSASSGVYLQPDGSTNYLHMNTTSLQVTNGTDNADIVFSSNNNGSYKATRSDGARYIVTTGTYGLTCSQMSFRAASLYIFKYTEGDAENITYYATNPTPISTCTHENQTLTDYVPATCTTNGYTGDYVCDDCGVIVTGGSSIPMLGHSYGSATNTGDASVHTYTCTACGSSYTENHTFTASTSGNKTIYTCSACGYSYFVELSSYVITYNDRGTTSSVSVLQGDSVSLPTTAGTVDGYTFAGWSASPLSSEVTSATVLTGSYTPTASVTLYAVYTRTEAGSGEGTYTLVTDASQLERGKNVIIAAKDYDYAMGAIYSTYYRAQAAVTKSGSTLTPGDGVYLFTLGDGSSTGTWSLYDTTNSAYLTAYLSGSYYDLGTEASVSANGSFSFDIASDGTAGITTNDGSCVVKYYKGTSYTEFKCVSSSTATDCYDCALYIETPASSDTTYYTTSPVEPETYTVKYSVLGSVSGSESVTDGSSVTLPTTATAVDGYTFVGWSDGTIDPESTTATLLTGSYTPTASVTLYAVYSRTQQGEGSAGSLVKMNSGDTLAAGDKIVVVANGTDYIMYQQTQSKTYVLYKTGGSSLSVDTVAGDELYYFDVSGSDGAWILGDATNGYLYNSSSNNLACDTANSSTWALKDNGDNTFSLVANGRYLSCRTDLTTANANLWRLGGTSATGTGTKALDIYKYTVGASSTTYYTTNPTGVTACTHESTTLTGAVAATCTTTGYTGDYVCDNCGETVSNGTVIPAKGHTAVTDPAVEATCTATGLTEGAHCSVCNVVLVAQTTTAALGHSYNNGVITTQPTCTTAGVKTFTCSRCSDSYTQSIAALGHTPVTDAAVEATCTATGLTEGSHCSVCNEVLVAQITTAALGHSYNSGVITTEPTCTTAGVKTFTCSRCSDSYTQSVDALGHTPVTDAALEATCTATGLTEGSHCSVCNEVLVAQTEVPALGHSWGEGVITLPAGEYTTGIMTFTCLRCGETKQETIPALGHTHQAVLTEATPATCTTAGNSAYYYCSGCGCYFSDSACETQIAENSWIIPATGHTEVPDAAVAPTCTTTGLTEGSHCSVCGAVIVAQEVVPATGHTEATDAAVAPTCTTTGLTEGSHCSVCGVIIVAQETVAALGHSYTYVDNGDGTHTATCSVCNDTVTEEHTFVDGTCVCDAVEVTGPVADDSLKFFSKALNMQSYLGFQFIVAPKVYSAYDRVWVEIYQTKYDKTAGADAEPSLVSYSEMEQSGYHGFEIKLDSVAMTDNLDVTLYAEKDGITYIGEHITGLSARSQAVSMANTTLAGTLTEKKINQLHTLADLLVYGAAAQNRFGFRTTDLATDGVSDAIMAYATTAMPDTSATVATEGTEGTVSVYSKALNLASVIEQQIIYKFPSGTNIANYEAHILVDGSEEPIVIDGTAFQKATSTIYGVSYSGLGTNKMGTEVRISIWEKATNTQVSVTTVASINAMASDMYNNTTNAAQQAAAIAVINYGASSKAYFG